MLLLMMTMKENVVSSSYYIVYTTMKMVLFAADIRVGYNRTVITTLEGDVFVTLCAVIFEPTAGGAPRPFTLTYNTADGTAGNVVID